jgi:pyruvate/2-oxoglutarate dehydrogenase complex dihydrolipoamide acyltransferase (E2) component
MPGLSFQKIVSYCELLNSTLKPQLTEMPHLQDESAALDALVLQAKSLDNEQQVLRGRLREITRLRRETERQGQDLRSRIAAQIRGKMGFDNENLLGFGIPPRKRTRKKPQDPAEAPSPAPVPAPSPQPPPRAMEAGAGES